MDNLSNGIEPSIKSFLEELNSQSGPEIYELSVDDARGVLLDVQNMEVNKLPADIEDWDIPEGHNGPLSIRIVRPKGNDSRLPVVMYFHGGGWILGDKTTQDRLIREIANGSDSAVVFVNYTPSPEAQYPVPLEEAYAATKYIAENGSKFNLDTSRIVVIGDSVGGNMATAVTMMAKERGGPDILFQILFYPVTDSNFNTDSYNKFATKHWLTKEAMKWFWDNYLPDQERRNEPTASPLKASLEQLSELPPAMIINGEFDVLRDEDTAYAQKLIEAGVMVTALRYLGTIHDFVLLNPITETPATRAAIKQANEMLIDVFKG